MPKRWVDFMDRQILKLEEELECPVCLEVATTAPIYKCPEDHLICRWPVTKMIYAVSHPALLQDLPAKTIRVPSMQGCLGGRS